MDDRRTHVHALYSHVADTLSGGLCGGEEEGRKEKKGNKRLLCRVQ